MKIERQAIVVATLVLIFFTVLPLASSSLLPSAFINSLLKQSGVDIANLMNRVAVLGGILAILVLLRGAVKAISREGLTLSIAWKMFWFIIVIFALGLGKIENLGFAVLSSEGPGVLNVVIFDLRLIAVLAAVIVVLKIVHAILEFQEAMKLE